MIIMVLHFLNLLAKKPKSTLPFLEFFLMAEQVVFLTGLKDICWPVGEPDSLGRIYTSHFNMECTRAGLPVPWASPAHKHWPKPV